MFLFKNGDKNMIDFSYDFTLKNSVTGEKLTKKGVVQDEHFYVCGTTGWDKEIKKFVQLKPETGARVQVEKIIDDLRKTFKSDRYALIIKWVDPYLGLKVRSFRVAFSELNSHQIDKIDKYINSIEIDPSDLDNTHYDPNPYGVEDHLIGSSGCYVYDDAEYYEAQISKALKNIEADGAWEYIEDFCLDENGDPDEDLNEKVIQYLRDTNGGWYVAAND